MPRRIAQPNPEYLAFLSPFPAAIQKLALATRALVLGECAHAGQSGVTELIYDAYNAVASGYSYTGRASDCFIHIAVYARWVNLGFNRGSLLPDPERVLQGSGRWIRHIRIAEPADLKDSAVRTFVRAAIAGAVLPDAPKPAGSGASEVRAIYPRKRRPKPLV
jgi:hypothetical protein